jgi:1-deoxy-D-xylulose-5-phosphate reductoisomerase
MDFSTAFSLEFEPPNRDAFRCLDLAYDAGRAGETAPAWLSGANEVVVEAFLAGRIKWVDIAAVNDEVLQRWPGEPAESVEAVMDADASARRVAEETLGARIGTKSGLSS